MIRIEILRNRDHERNVEGFVIQGHSGYARQGSDIICAAVSAVAYTASGALMELTGADEPDIKDGFMKCKVKRDAGKAKRVKASVILEAALIGFRQIEKEHSKFVTIVESEVI